MIRLNFCDYSDTYIHVKETIIIPNTGTGAAPNHRNKKYLKIVLHLLNELQKYMMLMILM